MLKLIKREKGQAMVEFALILPILLLLVCGIIDFGWLFYNQLSLDNACRETARIAVVNSESGDLQSIVEIKAENEAGALFKNDIEVEIVFSNPSAPVEGDITIYLTTDITILTPVLGTINGGQIRAITSSVTMKAES